MNIGALGKQKVPTRFLGFLGTEGTDTGRTKNFPGDKDMERMQ